MFQEIFICHFKLSRRLHKRNYHFLLYPLLRFSFFLLYASKDDYKKYVPQYNGYRYRLSKAQSGTLWSFGGSFIKYFEYIFEHVLFESIQKNLQKFLFLSSKICLKKFWTIQTSSEKKL